MAERTENMLQHGNTQRCHEGFVGGINKAGILSQRLCDYG